MTKFDVNFQILRRISISQFDCTLKSEIVGIPGLVLPGGGTAWSKSEKCQDTRDGW